ncbi:hypothetical protein [Demequina activiva]|uniref:Uncharacterized protein n=1 Tax=Demequina activiva TaxID=1582364 RepID=A0A919Q7I4_9MICO|nr:hypothetical protein [Demequina activiva]GIG55608.1 hypothetical protein Dac01nite_23600 [Demequina activiva]
MDELEKQLRGTYDAARAQVPESGPTVYPAVRAGARRRRTVRATLTAAVAVVAVGVVGMGAFGIATINRAEPALPVITPDPTPSASAEPTPAPAPSPTASTAPAPAETPDPRFDDSPDGIAEDSLPALAAERGYLDEPTDYSDGVLYPRAHVMEDWVWDAVGDGWGLYVAAARWSNTYIDEPLPQAVLYLASPEDVYFELFELPERAWGSARVTSWREDLGTATIWWRDVTDDHDRGAGAVVDLRTGEVDDLVMAVYGATAYDYTFVMANAGGDELWRAESEAGVKFYRWSDGADEDGWVATALVEQEPTADDAVQEIGLDTFTTTVDGNRVLLRRMDELAGGGVVGAPMTLLTYDLDVDRIREFRFDDPGLDAQLRSAAFDGHDLLVGWITYVADPIDGSIASYNARLDLTGTGKLTRLGEDEPWGVDYGPGPFDVYFGEATPLDSAVEYCGC